jgi:hypothetical protein
MNVLSFRLAGLALMMTRPSAPIGAKMTEMTMPPSFPMACERPSLAGTTIAEAKNSSPIAANSTPCLAKFDVRFGSSQVIFTIDSVYTIRGGVASMRVFPTFRKPRPPLPARTFQRPSTR